MPESRIGNKEVALHEPITSNVTSNVTQHWTMESELGFDNIGTNLQAEIE